MVQEKSININANVQRKKWAMENAIIILHAISLNAFGMDTTVMIYFHFLLITLINALVIIKGIGSKCKFGFQNERSILTISESGQKVESEGDFVFK